MEVIREKTNFRQSDNYGSGAFGASRSHAGDHQGIDIIAYPGDYVYSPIQGEISKYGLAYANADYRYIEVTGEDKVIRIFYAELDNAHFTGKEVEEGQFLGVVQDISKRYPGITPHVHIEMRDKEGNLIDPTPFFQKKK